MHGQAAGAAKKMRRGWRILARQQKQSRSGESSRSKGGQRCGRVDIVAAPRGRGRRPERRAAPASSGGASRKAGRRRRRPPQDERRRCRALGRGPRATAWQDDGRSTGVGSRARPPTRGPELGTPQAARRGGGERPSQGFGSGPRAGLPGPPRDWLQAASCGLAEAIPKGLPASPRAGHREESPTGGGGAMTPGTRTKKRGGQAVVPKPRPLGPRHRRLSRERRRARDRPRRGASALRANLAKCILSESGGPGSP